MSQHTDQAAEITATPRRQIAERKGWPWPWY